MTAALVERMAPEELWTLFQRVVPPTPVRPQGGGHRRRGDREVLAAIVFVATSGCTWNQLPPSFGLSGVTAFRRFTEWTEARVRAKLHRLVLDELGARGELDWSRCAIDSVSVGALRDISGGYEVKPPARSGVTDVALFLGGRPGARLAGRMSVSTCKDTMLRLIRALPEPDSGPVEALGVDEFALRRRWKYATVPVDMTTR